ncbi:hypothetical protein SAMN05216456_2728 [Devosia crocina]|uniref:Uncharacterized protein n=1 Tax=Devosia crocina TaxID=429728 RepID=A0A1I7NR34_9HYPH|nr:hypothetical protein [Devosia crocina]SFV37060.1 hypothetical protein SAMN05216456_2728 [Devosia crocina]
MLSWIDAGLVPSTGQSRLGHWQGVSGKIYSLESQTISDFVLMDGDLYLIARGNSVLWVGCSADLVSDPASRVRFRDALARADGVFRLSRPEIDDARLSLVADLEGALPARLDQAA